MKKFMDISIMYRTIQRSTSFFLLLTALSWLHSAEKTLLFLGDSITAGYGLQKEQAFPGILAEYLKKEKVDVKIINGGTSGDTTAGGLRKMNWFLKRKIDLIVISLGGNDGLRGLSVEASKANLQGIIDKARKKYPDIKIILSGMQVPPNMGEAYAKEFKAMYPAIAEKNKVTLFPFLLEGVGGVRAMNLADGIHPNKAGQKMIADNMLPFVKKALK